VIKLDIFDAVDVLPNACAACITSEHLFEHFTLEQGHVLLREWMRILKPGGVLRIVCPDLEIEAKVLLGLVKPASDEVIEAHRLKWLGDRRRFIPGERLTRAMVFNDGMRLDGHKFVYDRETLTQSMALAGFEAIERREFGESCCAALRGIDVHDGGETGRTWIPSLALVMEGRRPGQAAADVARTLETAAAAGGGGTAAGRTGGAERQGRIDVAQDRAAALKRRVIELTADLCRQRGYTRIALYGGGAHTAPITREPWGSRGIEVAVVLDDAPRVKELGGVRVCTPGAFQESGEGVDAVVISSDAHEGAIYARAREVFGRGGEAATPIVTMYA